MNNATPNQVAELWQRAQLALDQGRAPSDDESVLDLLIEIPGLALEMDQLLLLEAELGQIERAPAPRATGQPRRFVLTRSRVATLAAALLITLTPFAWRPQSGGDQAVPGEQVSTAAAHTPGTMPTDSSPELGEQVASLVPPPSEAPLPKLVRSSGNIQSFEMSVTRKTSKPPGGSAMGSSTASHVDAPRASIRTYTTTRTRTAPKGPGLKR